MVAVVVITLEWKKQQVSMMKRYWGEIDELDVKFLFKGDIEFASKQAQVGQNNLDCTERIFFGAFGTEDVE